MSSAVLIAVLTFAAALAGYTGFGFNLLATPMLILMFPVHEAVLLSLAVGTAISGVATAASAKRQQVRWALCSRLLLGSLPGVVVGALFFARATGPLLTIIVGSVCAMSAIWVLLRIPVSFGKKATGDLVVGGISGVLASVASTGGPPVLAYVSQVEHKPTVIRSTVLAHGCGVGAAVLVLALVRRQTDFLEPLLLVGFSLPILLAGLSAGMYLSKRSSETAFRRTNAAVLLTTAALALSATIIQH